MTINDLDLTLSQVRNLQDKLNKREKELIEQCEKEIEKAFKKDLFESWGELAKEHISLEKNENDACTLRKTLSLKLDLDVTIEIFNDYCTPADVADDIGDFDSCSRITTIKVKGNDDVTKSQAKAISQHLRESFVGFDLCDEGERAIPGFKEVEREFKKKFEEQVNLYITLKELSKDGDEERRKHLDFDNFLDFVAVVKEEAANKAKKKSRKKK